MRCFYIFESLASEALGSEHCYLDLPTANKTCKKHEHESASAIFKTAVLILRLDITKVKLAFLNQPVDYVDINLLIWKNNQKSIFLRQFFLHVFL